MNSSTLMSSPNRMLPWLTPALVLATLGLVQAQEPTPRPPVGPTPQPAPPAPAEPGTPADKPAPQTPPGPAETKASGPAPPKADNQAIQALAGRVAKALYREGKRPAAVTSYRARLSIEFRDASRGHFQVSATQDFRAPRSIRTEIRQPKKHILRGHDGRSFWQVLQGGKVKELNRREYKQDKRTIRTEYRFANQVIRLFQVDRMLLELRHTRPLQTRELAVVFGRELRRVKRPCIVVEGRLEHFPFYKNPLPPGYTQGVDLKIILDKATALPVQLEACPSINRLPATRQLGTERIQMHAYWQEPKTGIRIPTGIRLATPDPRSPKFRFHTDVVVSVEGLELQRAFPENHFSPFQAQRWALGAKEKPPGKGKANPAVKESTGKPGG